MSGRRTYSRYGIANSEGVLRVLRDVDVRADGGDFVALSTEAAVPGDLLTIEDVDDEGSSTLVWVVESRPVMVGPSVRHQLRLRPLNQIARG